MSEENPNIEPAKRTDLLTVLCILSFIGGCLAAFSNLSFFLSYDIIDELMPEIEEALLEVGLKGDEFNLILSGGKNYFLAGFVLSMVSVLGVSRMWKLKKPGFHFYTAAQIFLLLLPFASLEGNPFSFSGMLLTGVFIFAYSTQLKFMN